MTEPIRAAVIGFGLGGRVFHTAFIHAVDGLQLAAIVQRRGDEAAQAYPDATIYRSVDEMLADESIQLVAVTTSNHTHFELGRQALLAGKHVVIDKPFALTSAEAAELIHIARERKLVLSAFQNRRWDGDFRTLRELVSRGVLGRLVVFESHYDRFRQEPRLNMWKEDGVTPGGGMLYDLGSHIIDQALALFDVPETITADIRIDRDAGLTDDAFDLRLSYPEGNGRRLTVLLRSTMTAAIPGARFTLHGTQGSFVKFGIDPQEDAIKAGVTIGSPGWGEEPESLWGTLKLADGSESRIRTEAGDYRGYYENIRDAILGEAAVAVPGIDAWRTTRIIELARQSSAEGRTLPVELGPLP
ncbi:Gfo/Idh/MocA family oxidoreductase [Acidisarcina polymorpha]|nr:Gfo/Idh/MocA family oxidoreductase [Acidisarcina polymorpha]